MRTNNQISTNNPAYTQWAAQANQQKAMAASGKPSTRMQGAIMASGGGPAYGQVQNTINNAWKNYQVSPQQYNKEVQAGNAQAEAFRQKNAAIKAKNDASKKNQTGTTGGATGGNGSYNAQSTISPTAKIADALTEDAAQNVLAQGYQAGDKRYQTKALARPGFSQGKGQEFAGARKATEQMNQFAGQAANIRAQDQLFNNQLNSDYQKASEMDAQQNAMMQHSLGQSDWAKNFAQQSIQAQNQMAYLQGMLGLQMALLR
jgi:hypothetical protein